MMASIGNYHAQFLGFMYVRILTTNPSMIPNGGTPDPPMFPMSSGPGVMQDCGYAALHPQP